MNLSKLHFITQTSSKYSNKELVEQACKSGVKLVQLRIKNQPLEVIYDEAKLVKAVCRKYKATFILNDYVEIAKELQLDGIHLGKSDLSPIKAREILGENYLIGGTANDLEDVLRLTNANVDYIGLGPYQFTTTKENLSPVIGIKGYQSILSELKNRTIPPIYAIGGITQKDISPLLKTGVYGVALSGLIANATSIKEEVNRVILALQSGVQ